MAVKNRKVDDMFERLRLLHNSTFSRRWDTDIYLSVVAGQTLKYYKVRPNGYIPWFISVKTDYSYSKPITKLNFYFNPDSPLRVFIIENIDDILRVLHKHVLKSEEFIKIETILGKDDSAFQIELINGLNKKSKYDIRVIFEKFKVYDPNERLRVDLDRFKTIEEVLKENNKSIKNFKYLTTNIEVKE